MANYHLHGNFVQRSTGRSAVAASAYIGGKIIFEERREFTYDYSKKTNVIYKNILAPKGAPDWALQSDSLWNKVENYEDQLADARFVRQEAREAYKTCAQTAQTFEGSIPVEFDEELAIESVEKFVNERFVSRGLVVDVALHWDKGNPHFHALISRRALEDGEFSTAKDREICTKAALKETRALWAEVLNHGLEKMGSPERVDHRSFKDRGLKIIPTYHEGWAARHRVQVGKSSRIIDDNEEIRQENIKIFKDHPEELIKLVAGNKTVFSKADLEAEIFKRVGGDPVLHKVLSMKVAGVEIPNEIGKTANDDAVYEPGDSNEIERKFTAELEENASKLSDIVLTTDAASSLGSDVRGREIYTAKGLQEQEEKIVANVETLLARSTKQVQLTAVERCIAKQEKQLSKQSGNKIQLSQEQTAAVEFLTTGPDVRVMIGRTGTGKTTIMAPVVRAYENAGYRVLGTAFQGKTTENMQRDIGINSHTIDFFNYRWKKYRNYSELIAKKRIRGVTKDKALQKMQGYAQYNLTAKDVVVVDEANMIDMNRWSILLDEVASKGAKLLVIQDPNQIKAVGRGDVGRVLLEQSEATELTEIYRQRIDWQKQASQALNQHDVERGLAPYIDNGRVVLKEEAESAKWHLIEAYVRDHRENANSTKLAMAYTNKDVMDLNLGIRSQFKALGLLSGHFEIHGREFSIGDRVTFKENDNIGIYVREKFSLAHFFKAPSHGVKNGTLGSITGYNTRSGAITVLDDNGRSLVFNPAGYDKIDYGYAITVNKSEGDTVDRSYLFLDPLMNANSLLVGMTRHRDDLFVAAAKDHFPEMKDLVSKLSKGTYKKMVTDYTITEENRPFYQNVRHYHDISQERHEFLSRALESDSKEEQDQLWSAYESFGQVLQEAALEIVNNWDEHHVFAAQANLRRDVLEVAAGLRQRLLSELELQARSEVMAYFDLCAEKNKLWSTIKATHPGSLAKEHELYPSYDALRDECYAAAYPIASTPSLYKQFFKFTKLEKAQSIADDPNSEAGPEFEYRDSSGRIWDKMPATWQALQGHSKQYIESQREDYYVNGLSEADRADYALMQGYMSAVKDVASSFHRLKELDTAAVTSTQTQRQVYQDVLDTAALKRDQLAFKIIEEVADPYRFLNRFATDVDKLLEEEAKFLRYAVAGEVRGHLQSYTEAESYQDRIYYAAKLTDMVLGNDLHKPSYALLKNLGADPAMLQFEANIHALILDGKIADKDYSKVFVNFEEHHAARAESSCQWNLIKSQVHKQVVDLQEELLQEYKHEGVLEQVMPPQVTSSQVVSPQVESPPTTPLQEIRGQVIQELKSETQDKISEMQILQEVSKKLTANDWVTDKLAIEGQNDNSPYVRLTALHASLQAGASGYLQAADVAVVESWQQAKAARQQAAYHLLNNREECSIVALASSNITKRLLEVDAHEYQIKTLVSQYSQADTAETKLTLAQEIVAWKEFEHRENTSSTVVEIMSQGVRFEDLEALQIVAEARANGTTFAGKELEKFVVTAESFSHWKQEYSKIWQQISADVVAKTAPLELEYAQVKQQVKQLVAAIINEHASGKTSDQDQQVNQESGQNEQTNAAVGEGINGDVLKAASKLTNRLEAQVKTIFNTLEFKQDISRGLIEQWFVAGDRQVLSEPADSLLQQQFSCLQAADAKLHDSLQRSFADQDITIKDGKFDKEGIDDCKDGDFKRRAVQ
ncbi:MAG: MobA/MobL family protein [Pseudomonadota bacterium]